MEELRQEPYKLPDGFSWDEIDILDEKQVEQTLSRSIIVAAALFVYL